MELKQYYLGCLSHASYVISDEKTKSAVVVDPQRDIEQYVQFAAERGYTIRFVFLTHFHADFLAGHIELRNRTGAEIVMGSKAQAEFAFHAAKDGEVFALGDVRLRIMETPGHTPEGISILVFDRTKSVAVPSAVLTGDTLFIGDVGRPDLFASIGVTADELADLLYDSLQRLRELPDSTRVFPAHGAGSMCGKNLSSKIESTLGEQKKFNYALLPMSREEFKAIVTADQPEAPEYFSYDAAKNRQERPDLTASMAGSLKALGADEVVALVKSKAQLLDVRDAADFEGAHMLGAINIGLQGKYATWCGSILNHDDPIVVIADVGSESEAIMRLGRIGFDNVAGFLRDGMGALEHRPELVGSIPRITAPALAEQLTSENPPVVIDVRSDKEWESGHIQGSVNIPLTHLRERLAEVSADRAVVVHCEGGYRSAIACGLLAAAGRDTVSDLVGGFGAWSASKLPIDRASGATPTAV